MEVSMDISFHTFLHGNMIVVGVVVVELKPIQGEMCFLAKMTF